MSRIAVFKGLVVDESNQRVDVVNVGNIPYYVVNDEGFLRHILAEQVDRQVLSVMQENVMDNRDAVVEGMLEYLGKEDLFTKAAIETSLGQMNENMDQLLNIGIPEETRQWLGLMGFRVIVNVHGEVVHIDMPAAIEPDE
ncbi:MAG: hypothetical protein P1S60_00045 [Anaerolineae bacterium]|nr:hypothetical protein [Anaerolineae bacterium]